MTATYDRDEMAKRLGDALKEKGISMRDASLGAGLKSPSFVYSVVKGGADPQITNLMAVAKYIGVSTSWLLHGFEQPEGTEEIYQLLEKKPESLDSVLALLRALTEPDVQK